MKRRTFFRTLVVLTAFAMLGGIVPSSATVPQNYTITTVVTGGVGGWIDTVEPSTLIPAGTTKHYRIKPERGYMISDVQIDGESIGPVMFATIPSVMATTPLASHSRCSIRSGPPMSPPSSPTAPAFC